MRIRGTPLIAAVVLLQSSLWATFHEMQIEQVIGGVDGDPTAQAIQLRLREAGNNFVIGTRLRAWDANGNNPILLVTFASDVASGALGDRILICSQSFANHITGTLTPDFTMGQLIPSSYFAGGKITFEDAGGIILWSVAFGNYTGTNTGGEPENDVDGNFGAPFAGPLPSTDRKALRFTGAADAQSTSNDVQYALTAGDAVFTNNAGATFTVSSIHHPVAKNDGPKCENTALVVFAAAVFGATDPADYVWTRPDTSTVNGRVINIPSAALSHAGTWTLVVTVSGTPLPSSSTTVVVNPAPSTTASANGTTLCDGGTLELYATNVAGGTFSWTGPAGFTSNQQNPTRTLAANHSGTYTVTVTANTCVSAQSSVVITVNPRPATPAPTSNSPVCEGQTLNLMAPTVASATYSWSGPLGYTSSAQNPSIGSVTPARAGTYSVTVTVGGCTSLAGTVNVSVTSTVNFTASNDGPVCEGGTLSLSVLPAADSYSWSGPNGFVSTMQNPSISDVSTSAAGLYSVVATVSGCPMPAANTTVTVTTRTAAPVASNNGPVLEGASLQLSASTVIGATYSWTGPGGYTSNVQNPLITNAGAATAGVYNVTATANGCPSVAATTNAQVTLTAPVLTGPSATPNPAIVVVPVQFTASATGVGPFTYSWDFGDGANGTGASVSHSFSPAGDYTVTVTATDSRNLTVSGAIAVSVDPALIGGGGSAPGEIDSDGDGFSDAQETAAGSSTTSLSSTPFGGAAAGTPETLSLSKLSIKLNFAKPLSDAITASGILPVPAGFSVSGQQVIADIGGVVRSFTLSAKGASPSGAPEAFKISIKAKRGVVSAQSSKWSLKIGKATFASALAGEGLTGDSDAKDKAVTVPVTLLFNQKSYTTPRSQLYSAKASKSGKTKDVK